MPIVEQLPYTPWRRRGVVVDGEFRWRLGASPLDLADWIELGPDADGWIAEKPRLLTDHRSTTFVALDEALEACTEVGDALVEHLRSRWPDRFGEVSLDPTLHPLDAASRLVPEDLTLLIERDGELVFGAGSVCFPNRWDLPSKLGRTMRDVHAPVARLNEQLSVAVDSFFDRLTPERAFWRLGWGILDVPDGYTPLDGSGPIRPVDPSIDDLYVRVERETLRRFPVTNCVLFTIRTYITPIANVLVDQESADAMWAAVDAMPDDIRGYKDLRRVRLRS